MLCAGLGWNASWFLIDGAVISRRKKADSYQADGLLKQGAIITMQSFQMDPFESVRTESAEPVWCGDYYVLDYMQHCRRTSTRQPPERFFKKV